MSRHHVDSRDRCRRALLAERERIRGNLRDLVGATPRGAGLDEDVDDIGEAGAVVAQRELDLGLELHERAVLQDVEAALDRMELGTWGRCSACGGPVGAERLEVLPWADRCAPCAASPGGAR